MRATDDGPPICAYCTKLATWGAYGWYCTLCREPCGDDETDMDPAGGLGLAQAGLDAMARVAGVHRGGQR